MPVLRARARLAEKSRVGKVDSGTEQICGFWNVHRVGFSDTEIRKKHKKPCQKIQHKLVPGKIFRPEERRERSRQPPS